MGSLVQVLLYTLWLSPLWGAPPQQPNGWRGIIPLHATRADVERLIGKPDPHRQLYDYEDETAYIYYQRCTCAENKGEGFNVPIDTVLFIRIDFKNKERSVSDFAIDLTRYKKIEDGHVRGFARYTDRDHGISYHTSNGKVMAVEYGWTTADARLRCPDTLKQSNPFASENLTASGKERLDRLALQLAQEPEAFGLVSLNQEYKKPGEAEKMQSSVQEYLRRTHGSVYDRLVINLSYQKDDMELFILRKDQKLPLPFPDK